MDKIRVLLVDDHTLFRKGLASLLQTQEDIEVVGEARNGKEALEKARSLMPDLILMDIYMPECDGLEATKMIKSEMPYVKIVILTVSDSDQSLFEAIKCGAQGYLLKDLEPFDLFNMIRSVFRGEAPISSQLAARILNEFVVKNAGGKKAPEQILTAREKEVLTLIADGASNKEIAYKLKISENTVKNHLRNIMEKLHLQNRVQLAVFAIKKGIVKDKTEFRGT